jgi:hypothetical protein
MTRASGPDLSSAAVGRWNLSAAAFGMTLVYASNAFAVTVTIPGSANPFLAGYPIGGSITQNGNTDTSPAQFPRRFLAENKSNSAILPGQLSSIHRMILVIIPAQMAE